MSRRRRPGARFTSINSRSVTSPALQTSGTSRGIPPRRRFLFPRCQSGREFQRTQIFERDRTHRTALALRRTAFKETEVIPPLLIHEAQRPSSTIPRFMIPVQGRMASTFSLNAGYGMEAARPAPCREYRAISGSARSTNILRRRFEISIVNEHRETMQKSLRREVRGQKAVVPLVAFR